jgi:hypothetical protein
VTRRVSARRSVGVVVAATGTALAACSPGGGDPPGGGRAAEWRAGDPEAALVAYFAAAGEGRYADAARLYAGSYEVLQGWNPGLPARDTIALWAAACRYNGLVCMPNVEVVGREQAAGDTLRFVVRFRLADGSYFVQGPCCGETEETMPSRREFTYSVVPHGVGYGVVELPVYVP